LIDKDIAMTPKTAKTAKTDKPTKDLQTFIENVNKKDKVNGLKITFGFTKRKRKR
jgi:hypothetical protein